ncbi:MAG: hypothetical protein K6B74_11350, partial [Ruminococcus sp.]|nr:hypothetical protein [Ruminococcus sp.]
MRKRNQCIYGKTTVYRAFLRKRNVIIILRDFAAFTAAAVIRSKLTTQTEIYNQRHYEYNYYPEESAVKTALKDGEPILVLISFDGGQIIMAPADEALEHHIL